METQDQTQGSDPLSNISREAAGIEADSEPSSSNATVLQEEDIAQQWRDAAAMGCGLIVAVYPELKADWTKETYDNLGNALDKCARHYGWDLADILGHPLLGLAIATWPMATSLSRVVKARAEAKRKQPARQGAANGKEGAPGDGIPAPKAGEQVMMASNA